MDKILIKLLEKIAPDETGFKIILDSKIRLHIQETHQKRYT